jgi:hypothetical protein
MQGSRARKALSRIANFFAELRKTAEQLTPLERWDRILSEALKKFLRGRILVPPPRSSPPEPPATVENGAGESIQGRQLTDSG